MITGLLEECEKFKYLCMLILFLLEIPSLRRFVHILDEIIVTNVRQGSVVITHGAGLGKSFFSNDILFFKMKIKEPIFILY